MESLPEDKVLEFNENTLYEVRKQFDLHKPGAMKQAVGILEEWLKMQLHFKKKEFDKHYLEITIILCKGSLEKAKARLDKACTLRTLMPHIFGMYDLRTIFDTDLKDIKQVLLPKMTKNYERVFIVRNVGQTFEPTMMLSFTRATNVLAEYLRRNDYALSYHVVFDYTQVNITELATRMSIVEMQEIIALLLDGYGFRISGIYMVSKSKMIEVVIALLKQVLSSKLGSRVKVFKEITNLNQVIEKEILPREYGGEEESIDELHEKWLEALMSKDHQDYMREINSAATDESLRSEGTFNDQYLGMPGTFRVLSVD